MRLALMKFYRMELVYDVLAEAKTAYKGNFSVLEFGTAEGYAFTKLLYATKYLGRTNELQFMPWMPSRVCWRRLMQRI